MALSSPGLGSNLNVSDIVAQLMAVESKPLTTLQKKEATFQAKLTAYGALKGALSSFQTSVSALADTSKFQSLTATPTDATILSAAASGAAKAGSYAITVSSLAQAQSITSAGQASTTAAIGLGTATTLTFQFGSITGGSLASGVYSGASFNQDAAQATGTVVIDNSNNSLQGIRDAINTANFGVTASIVNDGDANTPYKLVLTSNSTGQTRSMKITSSGGDASITGLLAYDPAGTQNLNQTNAAQNASLSINGLAVTSASNSVTEALSGVTLNLTKTGSTTLSVANNTASVVTAVQSLVQSYNSINNTLNTLTRYNTTTKTSGILLGDASIQAIQSRIRSTMGNVLPGLGSNNLTNLAQVGLAFQKDGSLTLDTAKLQTALTSDYGDFAALFAAYGKTTDSLVSYASATTGSTPGSYAVNVTALATQGKSVGSDKSTQAVLTGATAPDLNIVGGVNDMIKVTIDGGTSLVVALTAGAYADADALATQVQADIHAALTAGGQSGQVSVRQTGGKLEIKSNTFGAASGVNIVDDAGSPGNTGATSLLGGAPANSRVTTIKTGVNDTLTVGVSGTTATVTLAAGTYTSETMAAQVQSTLNGASAFTAAGISVKVSNAAEVLTITSNRYGSSSAVSIAGGTAATNLFGSAPGSTLGTDIVGTINGVAATGSGQYLTGADDDASEGLRILISGGAPGARGTVNFSKGYAYNLNKLMEDVLGTAGTIANSIDNANRNITDLQKRAAALNDRLTAAEKRYTAQFSALDTLISKMNTTSSYLAQQLANLPKISS